MHVPTPSATSLWSRKVWFFPVILKSHSKIYKSIGFNWQIGNFPCHRLSVVASHREGLVHAMFRKIYLINTCDTFNVIPTWQWMTTGWWKVIDYLHNIDQSDDILDDSIDQDQRRWGRQKRSVNAPLDSFGKIRNSQVNHVQWRIQLLNDRHSWAE